MYGGGFVGPPRYSKAVAFVKTMSFSFFLGFLVNSCRQRFAVCCVLWAEMLDSDASYEYKRLLLIFYWFLLMILHTTSHAHARKRWSTKVGQVRLPMQVESKSKQFCEPSQSSSASVLCPLAFFHLYNLKKVRKGTKSWPSKSGPGIPKSANFASNS